MAPQAKEFQTLILTQKGELKQVKIPVKQEITVEYVKKLLKSKVDIDLVATYEYNNLFLFLFSAPDGKAGTENQIELPPPHDSIVVFGDILVIASTDKDWKNPVPFTTAQYEKFYQYIFEGGAEEEEEEEEVDEDEGEAIDENADDDEDEDIVEEADDEDEEENVANNVIIDDEDDDDAPVVHKAVSKKKSAANAAFNNTGRGKQQLLMQTKDFKELTINSSEDSKKKIRENILSVLKKSVPEINPSDLEIAIFKATIKESERLHVICHWNNPLFENLYTTIARRIVTNMSKDSYIKNGRLIQRLHEKEFTLEELAAKNSYELYPEIWKELSDRLIMREQKLLEGNKGMATDQFKCHGCGKRECTYYEMQTRSADEPMTIFITCLNCGKRWRQ